ncbi:MAG: glycosyltransferase family 2 protein [Bacteroidota bacterium]
MISVIIIGRNEEKNLSECVVSVKESLNNAAVDDAEIIYVDSASEDRSVEIAKASGVTSIFILNEKCINAAVARNVGKQNARYGILLFVDADMILKKGAVGTLLNALEKNQLVTGWFTNQNKNQTGDGVVFHPFSNSYYLNTMGGFFMLRETTWSLVDGMRNYYRKKQDADFFLRLKRRNVTMYSVPEVLAVHRSLDYMNRKRMWKMLFRDKNFLYRGLLYSEHIFNPALWPLLIRNDYNLLLLPVSVSLAVCYSYLFLFVYLIPLVLRSILKKPRTITDFFMRIPFYFLRDVVVGLSFLFFWPRRKKEIRYEKVL